MSSQSIFRILSRLADLNVRLDMSPPARRRMRMFNFMTLSVFFTLSGFTVYNVFLGEHTLALIQFIAVISLVACPVVISKGYELAGIFWWALASMIVIGFITLVYGANVTSYVFMYPIVTGVIVCYEPRRSVGFLIAGAGIIWTLLMLALEGVFFDTRPFTAPFVVTRSLEFSISLFIVAKLFLWLKDETRRVEAALEDERQLVRQKAEELRTLVRVLSHDLLNGITVVSFNTKRANDLAIASGDVEAKKCIEKIERVSDSQLALIQRINEIQAVESGKYNLKLVPVSLLSVINQAAEVFEHRLNDKGLSLSYDSAALAQAHVLADEVTITHSVVNNIISNAIKFSAAGSLINITVSRAQGGEMIELRVKDSGIGMPANLVEQLFSASKPTSRRGTMGETGTGFGMLLVKSTMEKFGGSVRVESRDKAGHDGPSGTTIILLFRSAQA